MFDSEVIEVKSMNVIASRGEKNNIVLGLK
jgi:hypothetical protein